MCSGAHWNLTALDADVDYPKAVSSLGLSWFDTVNLKKRQPMLPPFIIEQIRRREEAQRRKTESKQPRLELPVDVYEPANEPEGAEEDRHRGVVVVDL